MTVVGTAPAFAPAVEKERPSGEITPRSIVIGLVVCALVSVWVPFSEYIVGASRMNLSQLPVAAMGSFFALILLNAAASRVWRRAMLAPAELIVIFVMAFIAAIMATSDLLNWPMGVMSVPYYFATPENRWMDDVWPHLRPWAVVPGPSEQLRWTFVGKPEAAAIPWGIWLVPLFWWGTFVGALSFGSVCLASLLRKQWADHERLAFPLAQVPLDLMSDPGGRWNLPAAMRRRAFWVGAGVPLFVIIFNIGNYFNPQFPHIPLMDGIGIHLGRGIPDLSIKLNFYVLGFAYHVNTDVLFSVWLWNIILHVESGIFARIGYSLGAADDPYSSRDALTSWQGHGAFIVFVLASLWMARGHLREVALVVIGRRRADDERELLPYRWAAIGGAAAALYMGCFLTALGVWWPMAAVFLFGAFVAYLGTARVIAQTGLVYMQSPLSPTMFAFGAFGTIGVPASQIVGMVGTYSLAANGRSPIMPGIFHVSWLGARIGRSGRRMFVAVAIGLVAAYLVGAAYCLYISYEHGATTFLSTPFTNHGARVYELLISRMQARVGVDRGRWAFLAIGAIVMAVLTWLQHRIPAWPIHPVGFPIAASNMVDRTVFAIFLAWLIKTLVLRIGGVEMYERLRPAFLGIVAGYALGIALAAVADWIWFPGAGHQIHNW